MAKNKPRIYLDATDYIDAAKGRHGLTQDSPARALEIPVIENLLIAAQDGDIEIYGSTLLISECLRADKHNKNDIPESVKQTFISILTSGQVVKLVSADVFVTERARDLTWVHGINCGGGNDAIHVATALEMNCEEFITTNRSRGPLLAETRTKLQALGLRVITASETLVLPERFNKPLLKLHESGHE